MDAPSLEAFKARLSVTLGSLVWWLVTLHIAGVLNLNDHCGPFQPRPFYDSMMILDQENAPKTFHFPVFYIALYLASHAQVFYKKRVFRQFCSLDRKSVV